MKGKNTDHGLKGRNRTKWGRGQGRDLDGVKVRLFLESFGPFNNQGGKFLMRNKIGPTEMG